MIQKLRRRAIQEIGSRLYINPDQIPHKSIFVTGTAWVCDLINSQYPSRVMFEPFNPDLVPEYHNFHYFQYMRPGTESPEFHAFAHEIFTGDIRNRWIDHQNERKFLRIGSYERSEQILRSSGCRTISRKFRSSS